jgi:flagellar biosynthetic protein FlhB
MADRSEQTEKPTPRRLEKAREQGRFPTSREALSAVTFAVAGWMILNKLPEWFALVERLTRFFFSEAFHRDINIAMALRFWQMLLRESLFPLLAGGGGIFAAGLLTQVLITGAGFSGSRLQPDLSRLNPLPKLKDLPGQSLTAALQSTVLLAVFALLLWIKVREWMPVMMQLPLMPFAPAIGRVGAILRDLFEKSILILAILGVIDFARQRMRYFNELKMSKQDIRDEVKESEGNPQVKQKIRRLQRDAARRRMMEQVPKATAVIVNPTHYAVALLYSGEAGVAPRVVAKGKNYLARRIREIAKEHEVPIVENPPLARSLYKSVEVGKEIPASLYRAVAEVLAYIYRLMGRLPGR